MRSLSFRARLAMTTSFLILAIFAAMWFYLPRRFERQALALVSHKAETLADLTAFTIHPAIFFDDRAALEEALHGTRQDEDVDYVIVTDPSGATLASFRAERASAAALSRRTTGGAVAPDRARYEVMTPIRDQGREIARLYLGVALARLHGEVRDMRIGIGILSGVVLSIGVLSAVLLSNLMTRPLRHLAESARTIASGDLTHRVPVESSDEIGHLAVSFNEMTARIAERDAALRQLSRRLLSIQEQERIRIAREIHDELGQALTAMKIDLQNAGRDNPAVRAISTGVDDIIDLVRRIATDLRPGVLDDLGVTAALEQQLRRVRESSGITTRLTVAEEPQLDTLTGATLYRIAQEALTNVVRHAAADEVEVSLSLRDGSAVLVIEDNGRGIAPEKLRSARSLGLVGMRERAELLGGTVEIETADGRGTVVTATLPLPGENDASPVR